MKTEWVCCLVALGQLVGCQGNRDAGGFGELNLALQTTGMDGKVYGLDATLDLVGPETLEFDLSREDGEFQQYVRAGTYSATLSDYELFEVQGMTATAIPQAELVSQNPTGVAVPLNGVGTLLYTFKTHGETVSFGSGALNIDLEVVEGRSWSSERFIESGEGSATDPEVAMDATGNAIAVWEQRDDATTNVLANRYDAATGSWGTERSIRSGEGNATNPDVAMDAAGNAIAVWSQSDGSIRASRYDGATDSWGPDVAIKSGSSTANAEVAMDATGNAIAVWLESQNSIRSVLASRYDAATDMWGPDVALESGSESAFPAHVAMGPAGNAIVVWDQYEGDGSTRSILSNRYDAATDDWGGELALESTAETAVGPAVAMDASGNAIVGWQQQTNGSYYDDYARRYDTATDTWGSIVLLETGSSTAYTPRIAMDPAGNAVAVWDQSNDILANRFDAARYTWGGQTLVDVSSHSANAATVAMDVMGNAIVVWMQSNDALVRDIVASRYDAATSMWSMPVVLESAVGQATSPEVAMAPAGSAVAVWSQYNGSEYDILANRFY